MDPSEDSAPILFSAKRVESPAVLVGTRAPWPRPCPAAVPSAMASLHILLFLLGLAVVQASILDGTNSDVSNFFSKGFNSVKDLFPTSFQVTISLLSGVSVSRGRVD